MPIPLPQGVQLKHDSHGLELLAIDTPAAKAAIYLHGAHITHWQPAGHQPVLWMSASSMFAPGKPIRGGVPICFPWFGPNKANPAAPAHGLARLQLWSLANVTRNADHSVTVTLSLQSDPDTHALWPHNFTAQMRATFGQCLQMELSIDNRDAQPLTCEQALHTYFSVGDVRQVAITGLAGTQYHDRLDPTGPKTQNDQPITISAETDRLYINTPAPCTLTDPTLHRAITVSKTGSQSTVVWNPWIAKSKAMPDFGDNEWPAMICIETANAAANAVTLAPGQSHTLTAKIDVSHLAR